MREHILFVDDDVELLERLRNAMGSMRHEWNISFCTSADEALQNINKNTFDVVISDIEMPEIDSARLLREVRDRCPQAVRLVISSEKSFESVLNAINPAHQCLAKPKDTEDVKRVLHKACKARNHLDDKNIRTFASQLEALPIDNETLERFKTELERSNPDRTVLARLASSDVGLAVQILRLSNSAFGNSVNLTLDPARAISGFSMKMLRSFADGLPKKLEAIALSAQVSQLNRHSVGVATLAREIASMESEDLLFVDACYVAGILHDLGKLVLCGYAPGKYTIEDADLVLSPTEVDTKERLLYGSSHAEIGGYLLALWGFPEAIIEAVASHHLPSGHAAPLFGVASVLHVANALQNCYEVCESGKFIDELLPNFLDTKYLTRIKKNERMPDWLEAFHSKISE